MFEHVQLEYSKRRIFLQALESDGWHSWAVLAHTTFIRAARNIAAELHPGIRFRLFLLNHVEQRFPHPYDGWSAQG